MKRVRFQPSVAVAGALALVWVIASPVAWAQGLPPKLPPLQPKLPPIQPKLPTQLPPPKLQVKPSLLKSLSPRYLSTTAKYQKNIAPVALAQSLKSTSTVTTTLYRGGKDEVVNNTTPPGPEARSGNYTCTTRNVNEEVRFARIPAFSTISDLVYPGAMFLATDAINDRFTPFQTPTGTTRRPYQISVSLSKGDGAPVSDTVTGFTLASYRDALQRALGRAGTANPGPTVRIEYLEVKSREELGAQLGFNSSVGIPPELLAAITGIPIGVNSSLTAEVVAGQTTSKSRLMLRVNASYFSVNASPPDGDNVSGSFLSPLPGADINDNLAVVTSIDYGVTGFIYFESNQTVAELRATLEQAFGVEAADQVGFEQSRSAAAQAAFNSASISWIACGRGFGIPQGQSVRGSNLADLVQHFGSLASWSPNNIGVPVAYTMNFVKDFAQAVVAHKLFFPNKECTTLSGDQLKYDVDVELHSFDVNKVGDLDGTEDLFGALGVRSMRVGNGGRSLNNGVNLWSLDKAGARHWSLGGHQGPQQHTSLARDISLNELRNLQLEVGGFLQDEEGALGPRTFDCSNCTSEAGSGPVRQYRLVDFAVETPTRTSINSLVNNGDFQKLQFGNAEWLTLIFYESGNRNDGETRVHFRVWVKPHP